MNREETIRMAEQAGFLIDQEARKYQPNCISHTHYLIDEPLTRFEALVRADERERNLELVQILVEAEREACAQICEAFDDDGGAGEAWALRFAQVVRARGDK